MTYNPDLKTNPDPNSWPIILILTSKLTLTLAPNLKTNSDPSFWNIILTLTLTPDLKNNHDL